MTVYIYEGNRFIEEMHNVVFLPQIGHRVRVYNRGCNMRVIAVTHEGNEITLIVE